jgi:Lon protease-like protein
MVTVRRPEDYNSVAMSLYLMPKLEDPVPLFPLPNLVLFPGAVQFLHLFEKRYRVMFEHLLEREEDERLIAMAHLRPGYQAKYHTNHAAIDSTLCVSLVVKYECLDDGRYSLLVRGLCRARVRKELREGAYRLAWLEGLVQDCPGAETPRHRRMLSLLRETIEDPLFEGLPYIRFCRELFESDLPLGELSDLLAFYLLPAEDTEIKQVMLEDLSAVSRSETVLAELHALGKRMQAAARTSAGWPPVGCAN